MRTSANPREVMRKMDIDVLLCYRFISVTQKIRKGNCIDTGDHAIRYDLYSICKVKVKHNRSSFNLSFP